MQFEYDKNPLEIGGVVGRGPSSGLLLHNLLFVVCYTN